MTDTIQTIRGPVPADALGRVLAHEHIASVHGAWGKLLPEPNPEWERVVLAHYTPLLSALVREHDCRTLVEVSPSWGGRGRRDLEVWAELSRRTGMNIVATTGYLFGYAPLPASFHERSAEQIADEFIRDVEEGMAGTPVRAGMLKAHVPENDDGAKFLKAIAISQRETGASVLTCAGSHKFILDLLTGEGVPAERIVLSHADAPHDLPGLLSLLRRGARVSFTLWGIRNPRLVGWPFGPVIPEDWSAKLLAAAVAEGFVEQVMFSMDYSAMGGFEGGRLKEDLYEVAGRDYLYLFTHVLPALKNCGVSDAAVETMMHDNPRRMLLRGE